MRKTLNKLGFFFIAALCLLFSFVAENSYAKTRYSMTGGGAWTVIQEHDLCRHVRNNGSKQIYIPTATRDEWRSFINNPPPNVVVQQCVYEYTDWADWGVCSVECGGGNQGRARGCELYGTAVDCSYCGGDCSETQSCNTMACQTHKWVADEWSSCTEQCGNNTQSRNVYCERTDHNGVVTRVAQSNCPSSQMPETTRACTAIACSYDWETGPWSSCSATCGGGENIRSVWCEQTKQGVTTTVNDSRCTSTKPAESQACATQACATYSWELQSWGSCSASCGGGTQNAEYVCKRSTDNATVSNSYCGATPIPITARPCNEKACATVGAWSTGSWGACSETCGGGIRERSVTCNFDSCTGTQPAAVKSCNAQACPTSGSWNVGSWSSCSKTCGGGTKTRSVTCNYDSCTGAKPHTSEPCNTQACITYSWDTTDWSGCNVSCGTGQMTRAVVCRGSDRKTYSDNVCINNGAGAKPSTSQSCNTGKECISKDDYDWKTGNWSTCSNGQQTRNVWCRKDSTEKRVSDSICATWWPKPATQQNCTPKNCTLDGVTIQHGSQKLFYKERTLSRPFTSCVSRYRSCDNGTLSGDSSARYKSCSDPFSYQWVMGDWFPCSTCGSTQQRELHCQASNGQRGATSSRTCGNPPAEATRSCQTGCAPKITCTQRDFDFDGWCQRGRTQCSNFNFNQIFCSGQSNCTIKSIRTLTNSCAFCRVQAEVCTSGGSGSVTTPTLPKGPWSTGGWGSCNKSCGGGTQTRSVTCNYSGGCTGSKPSTSRSCNTQACAPTGGGTGGGIIDDGGNSFDRNDWMRDFRGNGQIR